jgi:hypothetical protein
LFHGRSESGRRQRCGVCAAPAWASSVVAVTQASGSTAPGSGAIVLRAIAPGTRWRRHRGRTARGQPEQRRQSASEDTDQRSACYPAREAAASWRIDRCIGGNRCLYSVGFRDSTPRCCVRTAGCDPRVPSFVIWEGVTNYLSESAVGLTLSAITRSVGPGSYLLFTYIHRGLLDGTVTVRNQ